MEFEWDSGWAGTFRSRVLGKTKGRWGILKSRGFDCPPVGRGGVGLKEKMSTKVPADSALVTSEKP